MYQTLTPAFIKHFQGNRLKTEDAQDLAQDAILRVFDKLHTVTDHAAVMGWIWRVAKNQALTFHRTEKSRQKYTPSQGGILNNGDSDSKVDKDHEIDLGQGSPYEIDRQRNTPETALCMRQQFAKFLEDHPARARLIIAIVEDGLEGDDLAQWLGRTPRATDQYKSQTKLKLDAYLNVCITD
jgi:RNA polymerase sigma factor (sigma-70 family)